MALKFIPGAARLLVVAGLACGAVASQAAGGVTISHAEEALVSPGMSMDQVQQALGRPEQSIKYRNQPGPTYTYRVRDVEQTLFDVDFSADGRVLSMNERMDPNAGGGDGGRNQ
ncbi:hypothetical protein B2J86_15645 [Acidovorax sp. SRB_14]|uniref:outer membrane protein assembly factor BamE domain-containing protein n=1 Tax=unclassified Acidovorax TaxID=2684926 RepID=UPI00145E1652|nr:MULTISPECIES: outer membrane protein assembly factor BamE [unclassified Acidovorax]NMM77462.1 hypothetical protein [Acidovorax sp. SRB_24]NMM82345.1 hypothetical protein [Acidovorax sp. SRB_14]NMM90347.1 hypothetical protein [Rhodococcus sp. SRB_17]